MCHCIATVVVIYLELQNVRIWFILGGGLGSLLVLGMYGGTKTYKAI